MLPTIVALIRAAFPLNQQFKAEVASSLGWGLKAAESRQNGRHLCVTRSAGPLSSMRDMPGGLPGKTDSWKPHPTLPGE